MDESGEDVLDRAHAARQVLRRVARIKACLQRLDGISAELVAVYETSLLAIHETLILATLVHQLTIVDNETDISKGLGERATLKDNNSKRTRHGNTRARIYQELADAKWAKHPGASSERIAKLVAKEIDTGKRKAQAAVERAKREGLDARVPEKELRGLAGLSVKPDTIRKRIKKPKSSGIAARQ
jgi:hypothetical protein